MQIYLRILSSLYFMGFALHLADLLDLRLKFSEMSLVWKVWIIYLSIMDLAVSVGLWRQSKIGINLMLLVAFSQIVAYMGFKEIFGNQIILIGFHILTVGLYLILKLREKSNEQMRKTF